MSSSPPFSDHPDRWRRGRTVKVRPSPSTAPAPAPRRYAVGAYHDTLAVFSVWAVDRLVDGGLSDVAILWHPLTDRRSPLAWWDAATLAGDDARHRFVPSTKALVHEPQPHEPRTLVVSGR